jgi:hypothetical protein
MSRQNPFRRTPQKSHEHARYALIAGLNCDNYARIRLEITQISGVTSRRKALKPGQERMIRTDRGATRG